MVRRTKGSCYPSGEPIVSLPVRSFEVRRIVLSANERLLYNAYFCKLRSQISQIVKKNAATFHISHCF